MGGRHLFLTFTEPSGVPKYTLEAILTNSPVSTIPNHQMMFYMTGAMPAYIYLESALVSWLSETTPYPVCNGRHKSKIMICVNIALLLLLQTSSPRSNRHYLSLLAPSIQISHTFPAANSKHTALFLAIRRSAVPPNSSNLILTGLYANGRTSMGKPLFHCI